MSTEKMTLEEAAEKGLASMDVAEDKRDALKQLFPEVFSEDKINFDQLRRVMGDWVDASNERFGLNWPGKAECMKVVQAPSVATLKPSRAEALDFDDSQNVFLEGDNLEILKLLQKPYFSKIKLIYIDPPYNTGGEFIYPDKYQENLETYLAYTKQIDSHGKKFSTNTDLGGRFHANWLNMMYPRLYLAKNLLRDDGVIAISIGDHEVANLRLLCDLVFGAENFEGHLHWRRRHNQPNDPTKMIGLVAEHILVYAKNKEALKAAGVGKVELTGSFSNPDDDPRGPWASKPWKVGSDQSGSRYKITTPEGVEHDEEWMGDEGTYNSLLADHRIIFPDKGKGSPRKKYFQSEREEEGQCANNWWDCEQFGHNQEGNQILTGLMDGIKNTFSNPKPPRLIKNIMAIANCKEGDIVLDFFLGSGTTFQAALDYGDQLRVIGVQLPEPLEESNKEHVPAIEFCRKNGLQENLAEVSKERIRRLKPDYSHKDAGFKVFKLDISNFNVWDGDVERDSDIEKQLSLHIDHIKSSSEAEDILFEILLKSGFDLTTKIEKLSLAGKDVYSIADGALLICLDKEITPEVIDALANADPLQVICLDEGFKGNDQLKTNAVQTFKSRAKDDEEAIVFRTI